MALIETLKIYLDITWNDAHTNAKLEGILARAQTKICAYAGAESLDFADGTEEQQLLLDLCRYMWFNVPEEFESNYRHDLIMLRAKYKTEAMQDETDDSE
jgi:hypothetical protein